MISWWGPGEGTGEKKIMKISVAQQKKLDAGVFLVRGNGSKQPKSALTRRTGRGKFVL